ncbi:hypothetical protein QTO34_012892 [Cnephaeus nilssonii]|uniref:Uncharacterized protein n=1 Tax=Cnephaeus nilssonii TaxID=3371016 RepID=A0AA40HAL6_CNENI|nr:hypothetical protein QTO34_012892 [Eptesicus nilssonii]
MGTANVPERRDHKSKDLGWVLATELVRNEAASSLRGQRTAHCFWVPGVSVTPVAVVIITTATLTAHLLCAVSAPSTSLQQLI